MKKSVWSVIFFSVLFLAFSIVLAQEGLTSIEELGKELFFAKISEPNWMSCADCHAPEVGFTGAVGGINKHGAVYRGAEPQRFGNRKPPSAAYATLAPIFHFDDEEGLFIGGNFWDGRATGEKLGNPAADQALGPFLNPVEQNNPSKQAVLKKVADSKFAGLWEEVWGEPISYDPENIDENYDRIGLSIAAYEASSEVNQFSSKYDYYQQGLVALSEEEMLGKELFEGKAMCSACHPSEPNNALFTDFSFDNLGTPKNPENPFYQMDEIFLDDGTPINPEGEDWIDLGLGGALEEMGYPEYVATELGKHKVPTLRNVAKSSGNNFPKAYMHNGVFKSLKEVVHFYNTRDVESWPPPEVPENVNSDELGNLGLTDAEEDAIVAFLGTLSDGYRLEKNNEKPKKLAKSEATFKVSGPNPFNPSTTFSYSVPKDVQVKISVYNIQGKKITTLVNTWHTAGQYQATWDAGQMASGTYFVVMQNNMNVLKQKVLLIK